MSDGRLLVGLALGTLVVAGGLRTAGGSKARLSEALEIRRGTLPIVISVPHGGTFEPLQIPDRRGCTLEPLGRTDDRRICTSTRDQNSIEMARAIDVVLRRRTDLEPHLLICHLSRQKVDMNRSIEEGAQGDPLGALIWRQYHGSIAAAVGEVVRRHGAGLYVDLHVHGHDTDRIELGYQLSTETLELTDAQLNRRSIGGQSSLVSALALTKAPFSELLRGPKSLGGRLAPRRAVPSPAIPAPGRHQDYFGDGYSVRRHSRQICGVQIEMPWSACRSVSTRATAAEAVAEALLGFTADLGAVF